MNDKELLAKEAARIAALVVEKHEPKPTCEVNPLVIEIERLREQLAAERSKVK